MIRLISRFRRCSHRRQSVSRSLIGCVVAAFFFALPASLPAAEPVAVAGRPPLRILPVGDSITRGSYLATQNGQAMGLPHPDGGGWRKGLQDRLRAAGIAFDFVGDLDYLAYGREGVIDPAFDPHHHGLAGFGNARILSGGTVPTPADVLAARGVKEIAVRPLVEVLDREKPDVILLMSGANGFDAAARDRLIQTIGESCDAHLFVATITPQKAPRAGWEQVDAYNASLAAVVAAQQAAGKRITLVDMHAALTPDDLLPDGVHPNRAGMDKIAATWFAAIAGK
ncbi:MAG: SGNH/GDSL hydrolase family protein [Planctomycetia bacterium]